ncbi:MAG: helix-turn-helix transcriptional regulator [Lentisphaeria bacterium]
MNYFADIEFVAVSRAVINRDGQINANTEGYWGIGLMLGQGFVRRLTPEGENLLKMPFIYLCQPGYVGSWGVVNGAERENLWFIMKGARAERMVNALLPLCPGKSPTFSVENVQNLVAIHRRMLSLQQSGLPTNFYQTVLCMEEFIAAIYASLAMQKENSRIYRLVTELMRQINDRPIDKPDFSSIAAKSHISYDHFRHVFRQFVGKSPHDFLLQRRLEWAMLELRQANHSIKEIASSCGFNWQADFTRFFKKRTGLTPSEFSRTEW